MDDLWELFLVTIFGSGTGTALIGFFLKSRIEKNIYRFNKIFSDNVAVIKSTYIDLVKVENALALLLSRREPEDEKDLEVFKEETSRILKSFEDNFRENEIIFCEEEARLINEVINLINQAKSVHTIATISEDSRGSEFWKESVKNKSDLQKIWNTKFLDLKNEIKKSLQMRYQLLIS